MLEQPRENDQASPYDDRIVAFIDILGFKEHIQKAGQNADFRKTLIAALEQTKQAATEDMRAVDLQGQQFSDCLIMSAKLSEPGLMVIVTAVDRLSVQLLKIGVLARGAITIGKAHHANGIVFGQAVVDAYTLESRIARVPRVIVSQTIVDYLKNQHRPGPGPHEAIDQHLRRDSDGVYFVHFLRFVEHGIKLFARPETEDDRKKRLEPIEATQKFIETNLANIAQEPEIFAKFEWLACYWNRIMFPANNSRKIMLPSDGSLKSVFGRGGV